MRGEEAGAILILTGPIGSGKTAVAKELVSSAKGPTVNIEGDVFWSFIAVTGPQGRNEGFRAIMRAMLASAGAFARSGYNVILDFSIPTYYLEAALPRMKEAEFHLVMLKPSLEVCKVRAAARPEGRMEDYSPYVEFYDEFKGYEAHTISDDDAEPAELAARIREGLAAGTFRLG
jgi:chloramphenicol 3-O-phosphotransferase